MKRSVVMFIAILLSAIVSTPAQSVLSNPTTSQTVVQPAGTSLNVSGNFTAATINTVMHPEMCGTSHPPAWCSGMTPDGWINAAFANLPSQMGTVDIRGFGAGPLKWSNTVTCGANQTLLSDHSVQVQPATAGMTLLSQNAGCTVEGLWIDVTNQSSWSGKAISFTDNYRDMDTTSIYKVHTSLRHITLTANGVRTGDAIYISATNSGTQSVAFLALDDINVEGFGNCLHLHSNGGWINGNTFSHLSCVYSAVGIFFDSNGGQTIEGNMFSNFNFQYGGSITTAGIEMAGAGIIQYNMFPEMSIWDTTTVPPILVSSTNTKNNFFSGRWDGTVNDPSTQNLYLDVMHGTLSQRVYGAPSASPIILSPGSGANNDLLVPNQANTENILILDDSGNLTPRGYVSATTLFGSSAVIAGPTYVGNGYNIVYRCTAAGTLPVGALTLTPSSCGSSVDTDLRTK